MTRSKLLKTVLGLDARRIVMEACYRSNHWGRLFQQQGYQVELILPHQVKPLVVGNKNDHNGAVAITEAALRSTPPFILEDVENAPTTTAREFIHTLHEELISLDGRITANEVLSESLLTNNDDYTRLQTIPAIGPVIGRSIISAINDARQFKSGRQMDAWVGLTAK